MNGQTLAEVLLSVSPPPQMPATLEAGMDLLRRYRSDVTVRIAAADIAGSLPLVKVSDHLTWLAEAVLAAAMERAARELDKTHGRVLREDGSVAGLGAIAYGKFGGIELGYGSDLDLVFVYEDVAGDAESTGGARSLAAPAWFARLVQRVIHWLATLTPAGREAAEGRILGGPIWEGARPIRA